MQKNLISIYFHLRNYLYQELKIISRRKLFLFIQFQVEADGKGREMKNNNKIEVEENGKKKVQKQERNTIDTR